MRNNQRPGFNDGSGNYRRRGSNFNHQSNDERRGGYHSQQRNEFGGGRGRGGFDHNRNQFNNQVSYQGNQRNSGFRQDYNNQQRGRQFNDYANNQRQPSSGRGFMQNNNLNFNQQQDRQNFNSRVSIHC